MSNSNYFNSDDEMVTSKRVKMTNDDTPFTNVEEECPGNPVAKKGVFISYAPASSNNTPEIEVEESDVIIQPIRRVNNDALMELINEKILTKIEPPLDDEDSECIASENGAARFERSVYEALNNNQKLFSFINAISEGHYKKLIRYENITSVGLTYLPGSDDKYKCVPIDANGNTFPYMVLFEDKKVEINSRKSKIGQTFTTVSLLGGKKEIVAYGHPSEIAKKIHDKNFATLFKMQFAQKAIIYHMVQGLLKTPKSFTSRASKSKVLYALGALGPATCGFSGGSSGKTQRPNIYPSLEVYLLIVDDEE